MNDQEQYGVSNQSYDPELRLAELLAKAEERAPASAHRGAFSYTIVFMLSLRDSSLPNWSEAHATWERLSALYRVLERHIEACNRDQRLNVNEPPFHEVEHTKKDFLLFLEALKRVKHISAEAEAYRNRPPSPACVVL